MTTPSAHRDATEPAGLPFFNRGQEAEQLRAAIADARSGHGDVLLLAGDAGIGKTRLARVLFDRAQQEGAVGGWGAVWDAGGAPAYWPWIQALRGLVERLGAGAVVEALPFEPGPLGHLLPELGAPQPAQGPGDDEARFALFDAVGRMLRAVARPDRPVLLVLDDVHAAAADALLLLEFIARCITDAPVVVLATLREDDGATAKSPEATASLDRLRAAVRTVRLNGLARSDVAALVRATGGQDPRGEGALVRRLHDLTDGNPLFLNESLHLLRGGEGATDDALEVRLPSGLQETIRRRLDTLEPEVRELLEVASAIGREFRGETLAAAAGLTADELAPLIEPAVSHAILRPVRRRPGRWRFAHGLVREALHSALAPGRRAELHREVARALEALRHDTTPSAELAHHWLEAQTAGPQAAAAAVGAAARAGDDAMRGLAYEQAEELYAGALSALEALEPDLPRRCGLLLDLGDAQMRAGHIDTARATLAQAAGLADQLGDAAALSRAALAASPTGLSVTVGDDQLEDLVRRALEAGPPSDAERARLVVTLAAVRYWSASTAERLELVQEAIALARSAGEPPTLARVLADAHIATWDPDSPGRSMEWAQEIEALGADTIGPELVLHAGTWRIALLFELGRTIDAQQALAAFGRQAEALALPRARRYARRHRVLLALLEGRFADVEAGLEEGGRAWDRPPESTDALLDAAQLFALRWAQGRLPELEPAIRAIADEASALPVWRCALAAAYAQAGRHAELRRELERVARDDFAGLPRDNQYLVALSLLTDAAEALEDAAVAELMVGLLEPFAGRWVVSADAVVFGPVDRALGRLRSLSGDHEGGLEALTRARRAAASAGAAPVLAELAADEALLRRRRGLAEDEERIPGLVHEALEGARRLGLEGVARRLGVAEAPAAPAAPAAAAVPPAEAPAPVTPAPSAPQRPVAVLRREGDSWRVRFTGDAFTVRDLRGLRYLARLLATPDDEHHVLDLGGGGGGRAGAAAAAAAADLEVRAAGDDGLGPLLDDQAKDAYRERLQDLDAELEEAEAFHDEERAARAREEREALAAELAGALGLGGRDRPVGSSAEKARVNVTRAIRSAIDRLATHDPALGRHLEVTVRTGTFCSYRPEPGAPAWEIEA